MEIKNEKYLEHYGVKGMKWGVIRDRNRKGSSSPTGSKKKNRSKKNRSTSSASSMSDAELDSRINRLAKEQQLKRLTTKDKSQARQVAEGVLRNSGSQVLTKVVTSGTMFVAGHKLGKTDFGSSEARNKALAKAIFGVDTKAKAKALSTPEGAAMLKRLLGQ